MIIRLGVRVKDQIRSVENFLILSRCGEGCLISTCKMDCSSRVHVRSKEWVDDRREATAGADGLEMQEGISLRRIRLGERTVLTSLSPSHCRSVWVVAVSIASRPEKERALSFHRSE